MKGEAPAGTCARSPAPPLELSPRLAYPVRAHEEMAGREGAQHLVVAHSGQAHGSDTAALRAVRVAAELAGSDLGRQVGGDGGGGGERRCMPPGLQVESQFRG